MCSHPIILKKNHEHMFELFISYAIIVLEILGPIMIVMECLYEYRGFEQKAIRNYGIY